MSPPRDYAGQSAAERDAERRARYLATGLELIGTQGVGDLTVRSVIVASGLAPRYFYETIGSIDALQLAVFEEIAQEVADRTASAIGSAGPDLRSRVRAGVQACVEILVADPRKGRVLFTESPVSAVLARARAEHTRRFAGLFLAYATAQAAEERLALSPAALEAGLAVAQFAVGGMTEVLTATVAGTGPAPDQLVDYLTELVLATGEGLRTLLAAAG